MRPFFQPDARLGLLRQHRDAGDKPQGAEPRRQSKAEFITTVSWPDMDPHAIDARVQDPGGDLDWLRAHEAGLMQLVRDDRGLARDSTVVNRKSTINRLSQEVVTLRGFAAGEHTVNGHGHHSKDGKPVELTASIIKVNPRAEVTCCSQASTPVA